MGPCICKKSHCKFMQNQELGSICQVPRQFLVPFCHVCAILDAVGTTAESEPFCEVLFEEVLQALKGDGRRISVQADVSVA